MDTITLEGSVYTKLSVLAKKYNYTTDYIGQLCRSGKLDAQLVGRSWYATESSLKVHKHGHTTASATKSTTSSSRQQEQSTAPVTKVVVRPRVHKNVHRHYQDQIALKKIIEYRSVPSYDTDPSELVPVLKKDAALHNSIHVAHSNAPESDTSRVAIRRVRIQDEERFAGPVKILTIAPKITVRNQFVDESEMTFSAVPTMTRRGAVSVQRADSRASSSQTEYMTNRSVRRIRPTLPNQVRIPVSATSAAPDYSANTANASAPPVANSLRSAWYVTGRPYILAALVIVILLINVLLIHMVTVYVVDGSSATSVWHFNFLSLREYMEAIGSHYITP